jgi:hypothetical protein
MTAPDMIAVLIRPIAAVLWFCLVGGMFCGWRTFAIDDDRGMCGGSEIVKNADVSSYASLWEAHVGLLRGRYAPAETLRHSVVVSGHVSHELHA